MEDDFRLWQRIEAQRAFAEMLMTKAQELREAVQQGETTDKGRALAIAGGFEKMALGLDDDEPPSKRFYFGRA